MAIGDGPGVAGCPAEWFGAERWALRRNLQPPIKRRSSIASTTAVLTQSFAFFGSGALCSVTTRPFPSGKGCFRRSIWMFADLSHHHPPASRIVAYHWGCGIGASVERSLPGLLFYVNAQDPRAPLRCTWPSNGQRNPSARKIFARQRRCKRSTLHYAAPETPCLEAWRHRSRFDFNGRLPTLYQ